MVKTRSFFLAGAVASVAAATLLVAAPANAQTQVYRCGNEYTNQPAGRKDCKLMTGGNVTVVQGGMPPQAAPRRPAAGGATAPGTVSDVLQQRRDVDRKLILERELERAQRHQAELQAEYKNGEPDKIGGEAKNYQKYLDRVQDMKAAIARNQSDIAGIQRELDRVAPGSAPAAAAAAAPAPQ